MKDFKSIILLILFFSNLLSNESLKNISLQLQWKHQFEFAGFYMAKEKGFYKEKGMELQIKEFDYGTNIIDDVESGKSTFATTYPSVILEKARGRGLSLLFTVLQSSPHVLVSLKSSNINSIKDFKDKRIMINKDASDTASFMAMLKSEGLSLEDMEVVDYSFNIRDLIDGKVDIISTFRSNQLYILDKAGIDYKVWDPKDYGFDFYDVMVFTSGKYLKNNSEMVSDFREASKKGWIYAFNHIEETVDVILKKYNTQNKTKEALLYEAKELKKLAFDNNGEFGTIEKNKIQRINDIYNILGLTKKNIDLDEFIFNKDKIMLTAREKEYLNKNKIIKMCNNPNWKPIEFKEDNLVQGIAIDTMKLLEKKLDIKIEHIPTRSWEESQQFLKEKKCDILPAAIKTEKRSKYADFTNEYLIYKLAIITTKDKPFINNLEEIINNNRSISRKKASGLVHRLRKDYPNVKIVETEGYKEALQKVSNGEVYCTIAVLPVVSYYINEFALHNLQIAGYTDMKYKLRIAVRKDKKELLHILNKTLAQITEKEHNSIYEKWSDIKIEQKVDIKNYIIYTGIILALLFIFIMMKQHLLKKSLKEFDELINATMEGIFVFKNGICIDANKSVLDIFGYDLKSEVVGKKRFDFVAEESLDEVIEYSRQKSAVPLEAILLKKDGTKFHALILGNNLEDRGVRISSIIDISKLKHQEKLLAEQAKMASMGDMIANIAHQWRQPLSLITTSTSGIMIKKDMGILDDEFLDDTLKGIQKSAEYLSKTIDTFMNFIKEKKEVKEVILQDRINHSINIVETALRNNHIKLINEIGKIEPLRITIVTGELSQVIINIINNAKDAIREREIDDPWIKFELKKENGRAVITIEDNAGGIPQNVLPKIFEPYFTTKHKSQGTGLGLHMSYRIITESLKGEIYAKNTDNGARFYIELPLNN